MQYYARRRRSTAGFEGGIRSAHHRHAGEPVLPVSRRARSRGRAARATPTRSAISSSRRNCRSSSGARFPTTSCCEAGQQRASSASRRRSSRQVRRMLADPRSKTLASNFVFQWLDMKRLDEIVPDHGGVPVCLRPHRIRAQDFRTELTLFVDSIFREDRSVVDLLRANHTFLNERLALHYGITDVKGDHFRRVELKQSARWGLLGKGAVLMAAAYPEPHVAGAARRVHPRAHSGRAAGQPAAERPDAEREGHRHDQSAHRARDDGEAPREPDLRVLSRGHGSARLRARELRRDRHVARSRSLCRRRRSIPPASCPTARRSTAPTICARRCCAVPSSSCRRSPKGLMTYAMGRTLRVLRHADRPPDRARRGGRATTGFRRIVQAVVRSEQFRMRRVPQPALGGVGRQQLRGSEATTLTEMTTCSISRSTFHGARC